MYQLYLDLEHLKDVKMIKTAFISAIHKKLPLQPESLVSPFTPSRLQIYVKNQIYKIPRANI